jgi:hypothetical protein
VRAGLLLRSSALVVAAALWAGAALAAPPPPTADDCVAVYAVSNGFHGGLVAPREAVEAAGLPSFGAPWVEIGWGEARAYQAPKLTLGNVLGVIFAPGPSTLLIAPLRDRPDRLWGEAAAEFGVSREGMASLMRDVAAEAERDDQGRLVVLSEARGGQFVAARSRFRVWRMCNAWAAERLKAAGVTLKPGRVFTAGALMSRIKALPTCGQLGAAG